MEPPSRLSQDVAIPLILGYCSKYLMKIFGPGDRYADRRKQSRA
jgi:hypothetical protein